MHKKNWPDGLYERADGYYSWRNPLGVAGDPDNPEEIGIGRVSFPEASAQAIEANLHIRGLMKKPRLVDRLTGVANRDVDALVDAHYEKQKLRLKDKEIVANTLKGYRSCGKAVKAAWEARPVERISTRDVAELLGHWKTADQLRMAQSVRSYMADLFRFAEAEGWIQRGTNPVTITDTISPTVKRARLSLEQFQTIYDAAAKLDPWVQHAMALAIVSGRRREDLAAAEFKQRPDSLVWTADRHLYVIQQKVDDEENPENLRLRIPYELELKVLGWSLEQTIARCRSDNVVSRWLIHHQRRRTMSKPGERVWIDTITKGFARARKRTSLTWPEGLKPPTFHEIRSLAARLYDKQGGVNVQILLGHSDPETTEIYKDSRGTEWTDVKVA